MRKRERGKEMLRYVACSRDVAQSESSLKVERDITFLRSSA